MLEYDGDTTSFEETFMATFQVSYSDVFGTMHTHDLKEGGDGIPVSKNDCQVSAVCQPKLQARPAAVFATCNNCPFRRAWIEHQVVRSR